MYQAHLVSNHSVGWKTLETLENVNELLNWENPLGLTQMACIELFQSWHANVKKLL